MKVGDLVSLIMKRTVPPQEPQIGVVVEVKKHEVKVHWQKHGGVSPFIRVEKFKLIK